VTLFPVVRLHTLVRNSLSVIEVKVCSSIGTCIDTAFLPTGHTDITSTSFPRKEHGSLPNHHTKSQISYRLLVEFFLSLAELLARLQDVHMKDSTGRKRQRSRPTSGCSRLFLTSSLRICGPLAWWAAISAAIVSGREDYLQGRHHAPGTLVRPPSG